MVVPATHVCGCRVQLNCNMLETMLTVTMKTHEHVQLFFGQFCSDSKQTNPNLVDWHICRLMDRMSSAEEKHFVVASEFF